MNNPLLITYQQENYGQLLKYAVNIYNDIISGSNNIVGELLKTPLLNYMTWFGFIPAAFAIICFIMLPIIWCFIRKGNKYVKQQMKQTKLDK